VKAIEIQEVSKYFGALAAISNVSFGIELGERLAIIGPNGAGKTTLFNLLSGYLKPSKGRMFALGQDITDRLPYQRARLGIGRTFQIINLFRNLTVGQNMQLALGKKKLGQLFSLPATHQLLKTGESAKSFLLEEKVNVVVSDLSYGEQRILDIALALLLEPNLILLDEPTAGLSSGESKVMLNLIHGLPREKTLVIIEHDMDVVFDVADRIIVLHYGQVIADGSKDEVRANPKVREIYLGDAKRKR
jgi:branched-chain amino acid transport system ATP-binding protein